MVVPKGRPRSITPSQGSSPTCPTLRLRSRHISTRGAACALAPTSVSWGLENRTTAVRVPGGPAAARRLEHHVAGADANRYVLIATILAAMLDGMERGEEPPPPVTGDTSAQDVPRLPLGWHAAVERLGASEGVVRLLPADLVTRPRRGDGRLHREAQMARPCHHRGAGAALRHPVRPQARPRSDGHEAGPRGRAAGHARGSLRSRHGSRGDVGRGRGDAGADRLAPPCGPRQSPQHAPSPP